MDKYYFSNVDMGCNFEIGKTMNIFIYPSDWWNIKSWLLALEFNKNVTIVAMSNRRSK